MYATHAEALLEPGAIFIPLLEEFVELLSVETWHSFFAYFETREKRFTRDMPASKGKALPLLRTINTFLRTLSSTPADLQLRGRVQLFASRAISVSDKSAINMRGEYSGIRTTWEDTPVDDPAGADGDVEMDGEETREKAATGGKGEDDKFYSALWSLQQYFAHPPSLDGPATGEPAQTPFERFRSASDFVLERLFAETARERSNPTPKADRGADTETDVVFPRYLTARALLRHELADTGFRRQVLLQYFILFQFLLNLQPGVASKQQATGGMPKSFIIDGGAAAWIKSTVSRIRDELKRIDSTDGLRFEETVVELMNRERRYAQWKNDGCPEADWALAPVPPTEGRATARKWERQSKPPRPWPYKQGTPTLSRLSETNFRGLSDFKRKTRQTVFELEEEYRRLDAEEEDDRAMGRDPPDSTIRVSTALLQIGIGCVANAQRKATIRWLALRQARDTHPRVLAAMGAYDLTKLVNLMRDFDSKQAAARAKGQSEAEAEAEVAAAEGTKADADVTEPAEGEGEGDVPETAEAEAEAAPAPEKAGSPEKTAEDAAAPEAETAPADTPMEGQEQAQTEQPEQPEQPEQSAPEPEQPAEQPEQQQGDVEMADAAETEGGDLGEAE